MCGFANPLSFKKITDAEISTVANFIRENTMGFLQQRLRDIIDQLDEQCDQLECDVLVDDDELIDHFGALYAHNHKSFNFHLGDVILIKELVDHVKIIVDGNGINKGLAFFQSTKSRKRAVPRTACQSKDKKHKSPQVIANPIEEENLKAELISKVTAYFKPYMAGVHAKDETININDCIVVLQNDDGSNIYGEVCCIICKAENRKNQNSKRVYYNTKGKTKGCWVLSNITKHLKTLHGLSTHESQQLHTSSTQDLSHDVEKNVSHEEHYILETDANENLSVILVDDSELKRIENIDQDNQELFYSQLSAQIKKVMAVTLKHDEQREEVKYVLAKSLRKLMVAKIPGDGSCMFSSLAHQLFMHPIKSKEHKQATKQLRAAVVEHILQPGNYVLFEHRLRDRVLETGQTVTDFEKESKFFVRHILSKKNTWGGSETLLAVSILFSTNIFFFTEGDTCTKIKEVDQNHNRSLAIAFRIGLDNEGKKVLNHYDSVCEIDSADLYGVARKCCKQKAQ